MKSVEDLFKLLVDIDKNRSRNFSGIGLIMYNNINNLPISSLLSLNHDINLPIVSYDEVVKFLIKSSRLNSKYHDGFHLLNKKLELTHLAQYLSPTIFKTKIYHEFGSRYRTAIYTSKVPGVIACGVLSKNYPPTVFKKGKLFTNP